MYNAISKLKKLNDAVMSVVSGQQLDEGTKEEYEKFFRAALKKFGAESPADLDDDKKKEFFNYVEKNYKGEKTDESFGQRARKAKQEGKNTFEFQGKTYDVKESIKKYSFSVEEEDPEEVKSKKENKLDSSEVEEEEEVDGKKFSKETINAVSKLLNKKRLENKEKTSGKSLQDEEDEEEESGDEDKKDAKVAKKSSETPKASSKEEEEEEGKPPIKLSGKKDKVKVN